MSTAIQLRRGTTTEHNSFTGAVGEVTVDVTKDTVVIHDGVTVGGFPAINSKDVGVIVVEQTSTTGSASLPVGTTGERDGSPAAGYLRFNSTDGQFEGYDGSAWGAVGGGNSTVNGLWENSASITANYTLSSGNNAMSAGPITINSGVTVTVPTGSRWVVI